MQTRNILLAVTVLGASGCEAAQRNFWGWGPGGNYPEPEGPNECMGMAIDEHLDVDWKSYAHMTCRGPQLPPESAATGYFNTMEDCLEHKAGDVGGVCGPCFSAARCCRNDAPQGGGCEVAGVVIHDGNQYRRGRCAVGQAEACPEEPPAADAGVPEPEPDLGPPCDPVVEPDMRDFGLRGDECVTVEGALGRFVCEDGEPVCRADPTRDLQRELFGRVTPEASQAAFAQSAVRYAIGEPWGFAPVAVRVRQREVGNLYELWVRGVLEPVWLAKIRWHVRYFAVAGAEYRVGSSQEGNVNPAARREGGQMVWHKQAGQARFADYVLYLRTRQVWELKCPDILNVRPWWQMWTYGLTMEVNNALQAMNYKSYIESENRGATGEARAILRYRSCQGWPRSWLLLLTSLGIVDNGGFASADVDPVARAFNWSHRVICGPRTLEQLADFARGAAEWHEVSAVECGDCIDGGDACLEGCVLRLALMLFDFCMD